MHAKIKYLVFLFLLAGLASCSLLRKNTGIESKPGNEYSSSEIIRLVKSNNIVEKGVYINNGKAEIKSEIYSGEFNFYAKINREEEFVISLRGPLDIEVVRLYGNRDSAFIIDRLNKVVYKGSRNAVLKKYGIPEKFWYYILGDITENSEMDRTEEQSGKYLFLTSGEANLTAETAVSRDTLKAVRTTLIDNNFREVIRFGYREIENVDGYLYPGIIEVDSKSPLFHVEILIKSIKIPVNEKINFNIPEYKSVVL